MQNAGTAKARGENAGTPDTEEEHDDAIANAVRAASSVDAAMPEALAVIAASVPIPESARRRALDALEAVLAGEDLPPTSGPRSADRSG